MPAGERPDPAAPSAFPAGRRPFPAAPASSARLTQGMELDSSFVEFLQFVINRRDLECQICRVPPKPHHFGPHLYLCSAGHVVCHFCMPAHRTHCGDSDSLTSECCRMLEDIASRIEIKCACGGYFKYCKLKQHQINCRDCEFGSSAQLKCRLRAMLLRCSVCSARLQPPVFRKRSGVCMFCAGCHHADRYKDQFVRCGDLEYMIKCLMVNVKVKTQRPYYIPCDAYESTRPPVGNSTVIGKTQGKAPSKVCKMDNHIVDSGVSESDESEEESEDDSSDGIHPETGKRVAKTVLKTCAYNKKAKIATTSGGQKTVASQSRGSRSTTLPQQPTIDAGLTPKPRPTPNPQPVSTNHWSQPKYHFSMQRSCK